MRQDKGTALVESAFILMLIMALALGTFEFGTAFAERNAMGNAVREGARAGSAAGSFVDADCLIIEAAAGGLQGMVGNDVEFLHIFRSDADGTFGVGGDINSYRPKVGLEVPDLTCSSVEWVRTRNDWPVSEPDRQTGTDNYLGVSVEVTHNWKTGFAPFFDDPATWTESAVMALEPATS